MCSSLNQVFSIDGISYLTKAAYRNGFSKLCPNVKHFAQEYLKKSVNGLRSYQDEVSQFYALGELDEGKR